MYRTKIKMFSTFLYGTLAEFENTVNEFMVGKVIDNVLQTEDSEAVHITIVYREDVKGGI